MKERIVKKKKMETTLYDFQRVYLYDGAEKDNLVNDQRSLQDFEM